MVNSKIWFNVIFEFKVSDIMEAAFSFLLCLQHNRGHGNLKCIKRCDVNGIMRKARDY